MTTVDPSELADGGRDEAAAGRLTRLRDAVARARKARTGPVQLDRWLLIVGGVVLPLGVLLVLLGWFGAAHTGRLFEQIPYLISGGLLGVGLIIAGGFCYFAYWLTRLVYEGRDQNQALLAALERIEVRLDGRGVSGGQLSSNGFGSPAATSDTGPFLATPTGTMFHRPDCSIVTDKSGVREVSPDDEGMKPCKICDPLGESLPTRS